MNKEFDPSIQCQLCHQTIWEMADRGAFLNRTSPKGGPFEGECSPSCDQVHGNQNDALLNALEINDE